MVGLSVAGSRQPSKTRQSSKSRQPSKQMSVQVSSRSGAPDAGMALACHPSASASSSRGGASNKVHPFVEVKPSNATSDAGRSGSSQVGGLHANMRHQRTALTVPAGGKQPLPIVPAPDAAATATVTTVPVPFLRERSVEDFSARGAQVLLQVLTDWSNRLVGSRLFRGFTFTCLLLAICLPDLWVLADRPTNSDLDVLLTLVLVAFVVEHGVYLLALPAYRGTVMFWMDHLGAVSLLLDLSYLSLLPTSRIGDLSGGRRLDDEIGAFWYRAGRVLRLGKLMHYMPLGLHFKQLGWDCKEALEDTTSLIQTACAKHVVQASVRTASLVVLTVMIMPSLWLWTLPRAEYSMSSWLDILVDAHRTPGQLDQIVPQLESFYEDMAYYPYRLEYSVSGAADATRWLYAANSERGAPDRSSSTVTLHGTTVRCYFNVQALRQREAAANLLLALVTALLMLGAQRWLAHAMWVHVLRPMAPLQELLKCVGDTVASTLAAFSEGERPMYASGHYDEDEHALLSKIVRKTDLIVDLVAMRLRPTDEAGHEEMEAMGRVMSEAVTDKRSEAVTDRRSERTNTWERKRAVSNGSPALLPLDSPAIAPARRAERCHSGLSQLSALSGLSGSQLSSCGGEDGPIMTGMTSTRKSVRLNKQVRMLEQMGLSMETLDSWDLCPIGMEPSCCRAATSYFLDIPSHDVEFSDKKMQSFILAVEKGYRANPYHSWYHAVDVTHSVYRWLHLFRAEMYCSNHERFALLAASLCHDYGHPGVNNQFLVEARDALAILYNDKSPLENMHCSKLFEIVQQPKHNIFQALDRQAYVDARKVCVDAILQTDMCHHFPMIKQLELLHEVSSDMFNEAAALYKEDQADFPSAAVLECFRAKETRSHLLNMILHTSDVSNPTKPFHICRMWASLVLEEFFAQGDKEKDLGMPVGPLNDRDKTELCMSQIGFIEFVAPLSFVVSKLLPPYRSATECQLNNMQAWRDLWIDSNTPTESKRTQVEDRIRKLRSTFAPRALD